MKYLVLYIQLVFLLRIHVVLSEVAENYTAETTQANDNSNDNLSPNITGEPNEPQVVVETVKSEENQPSNRRPKTIYGLLGFLAGFRFAQGIGPTSYHADRREDAQLTLFSKLFDGALHLSYIKYPYFYPLVIQPIQYPPISENENSEQSQIIYPPLYDEGIKIEDPIQKQMELISQQLLVGKLKNDKYLMNFENIPEGTEMKYTYDVHEQSNRQQSKTDSGNLAKNDKNKKEKESCRNDLETAENKLPINIKEVTENVEENVLMKNSDVLRADGAIKNETNSNQNAPGTTSPKPSTTTSTTTSSPSTTSSSHSSTSSLDSSTSSPQSSTSSTHSSTSSPQSSTSSAHSSTTVSPSTTTMASNSNNTDNTTMSSESGDKMNSTSSSTNNFYPYPYYHHYSNASNYEDISITEASSATHTDFHSHDEYYNIPEVYQHADVSHFGYADDTKFQIPFYPYSQYYEADNIYGKYFYEEKPKYSKKMEESGFVPLGTLKNKI